MKENLSLYNTNQINKYGYKFTVEALESSLAQSWKNGTPMFISHDYHRLMGWSKSLGLQILPTQVALIGISYFPENNKEQEQLNNAAQVYLTTKLGEVTNKDKAKLNNLVGSNLSDSATYLVRECVCVIDDNIAKKLLPNIFIGDETDKRCLVSLKDLKQIAPGVFEINGVAVFAHRYFRRSLSQINNLNNEFLSLLNELCSVENLDLKIALDPHSIGLLDTYKEPIELEYWWGPIFDESLLDIPRGVTCHKSKDLEKYFHGISSTEFWWHKQNGIQSLECEEIRDLPSFGVSHDEYGCRYIHSMINNKNGKANHLDGAIRLYNEEKFIERLDVDISKAGKDTKYFKLWRIDGDIEIPKWKELICHFYRDNHLPGEYFSGVDKRKVKTEGDRVASAATSANHLLSKPKLEDGVEIFISYFEKDSLALNEQISVRTLDTIGTEDNQIKVIEFTSLELIKIIQYKLNVIIEKNYEYIAYEDLDINFPMFLSKGVTSVENSNKMIQCLQQLINCSCMRNFNRTITISFGIEYEDVMVQFSFLSNVTSMYDFFKNNVFTFPSRFEDIGDWSSNIHDSLKIQFAHSNARVASKLFLKNSGIHRISREFVPPEMIEITGNEYALRIKKSDSELFKAVQEGTITIVPASLVNKAKCGSCFENYLDCECTAYLDDNSGTEITDFHFLGFSWASERA